MIEVTDLVKNYGAVPAVRGVSLGVARGEVVVLIGPSGCGKSTLLRCVHLLEDRPWDRSRWYAADRLRRQRKGPYCPQARGVSLAHRHGVPTFRAVPAHDGA